ncbi:uncharacterized protein LOC120317141 isoform X1 [Crotalus tigris]|uniref:uncharacterized protein LOC120317141 isoform X1 n=1 Tax=Crotalus tigris TaxID=88082 RepID=UPI00192FA563|nr:uncharacterized protein LOC120317141 isoform X1 [Crotalus tigris]
MRLLFIFALTFTLSVQQDNKDNADADSTENATEMMEKVLDALSEEHTMEIINALNKKDVEKLTDCMEDACKMADFVDLMEKILYFLKGLSHGDKPIYDLIKALIKQGPLAELVNELSEKHTLEIINALTVKEIEKLMNIGKSPISILALISVGKKIIPIIENANDGKGVSKLISTFTGGGDGNTENSNDILEKIMNALSEEHTMKIVNTFNAQDVEKLTDCLEGECNMAVSVEIVEKVLNVLKGLSHGDKLIYNLIKTFFKHGPLIELVNELREEHALEIINALNGKDIEKLMNIDKGEVKIFELIPIGKKIISIIKKANGGKGPSKLISMFTDDEDGKSALPYYQPLPGGLHPGMSVYMQGLVPEDSNRTWVNFQVDFACGQHNGADVPLHFRSHINAETVGLNTFQAGRWRKEDTHTHPFQKGEHFEVIFMVNDFGYQVLANGTFFCNYRHRIPPQNVQVIRIDGDLELQSLTVIGGPVMTLPYHHSVPGGLHAGMSVYVQGKVPKRANSFKVDFACGKFLEAHILLHFNPRFGQESVVLNTLRYWSGGWGKEEKHKNPFQKGEHFEIIFIVDEAKYQILVNGNPFCNYKHRIPPEFVNFINFPENLELQSLTVMGGQILENMVLTGSAFYYPPVPYTGNLPGGLASKRTITIRGFIPKNASRFEIDLMAGRNIVLHINPHMKPRRYVVRNACLNGSWGAEESDLPFNPFQFGQYFEISICCDSHKFKVYTNGRHLFNFAHRYAAIGQTRTINIQGDVALSYINY